METIEGDRIIAEFIEDKYMLTYLNLKKAVDESDPKLLTIENLRLIQHTTMNPYGTFTYSDSLDKLSEVWKELPPHCVLGILEGLQEYWVIWQKGETVATIQEVAWLKTIQAIQELKNE